MTIDGGYILLARKLLKSGIMQKPPLFMKLWVWMLMQASHTPHDDLQRGQFFTSIEKMQKAMSYKIGFRQITPSKKEIRTAYESLSKGTMIGTTKGTHGMIVTICNYDLYQTPTNYEGHNEGRNEKSGRGTILTRRENKNDKPPADFQSLKARYSDPSLIDQAFAAFASCRKYGKVAESVLEIQLRAWQEYTVEQVEAGIRTYLAKDYAGQGKDERYLLGIIRNGKPLPAEPHGSTDWWQEAGAI